MAAGSKRLGVACALSVNGRSAIRTSSRVRVTKGRSISDQCMSGNRGLGGFLHSDGTGGGDLIVAMGEVFEGAALDFFKRKFEAKFG